MKKNKFVKVIEHILVSLPLIYVGATSLYVTFNKNAKDSYYDINSYTLDTLSDVDEFEVGNTYYFANEEFVTYGNTYGQSIMGVSNFVYQNVPMVDCANVRFYSVGNDTLYIVGYDINNTQLFQNPVTATTTFFSFTFEGIRFASSSTTIAPFLPYFSQRVYDKNSFLNNAIPYAISEFNKLGFNKINFTGFFVNIFHNGETNVYIDFVNNYLNYMLFVETCYVLPMVLYWFIHMGEDILNRFSHKEW